MSDLIERQELMDAIYKCTDIYVNNLPIMIYKAELYKAISEIPSAEPEIIRCKDCFYGYCEVWLTGGGEATSDGYCGRTNLRVLPYDFCSKAERRTDD